MLLPIIAMSALPCISGASAGEVTSYYKERPLFNPYPGGGRRFSNWDVKNFGPVGIGISLQKPIWTMVITRVEKGSPAEKTGKLQKGQIIESINGVTLKNKDPRIILGDIITKAEATDGKISLNIKDLGNVVVQIPVMGSYSSTWPLNCKKSDKIVRNLADLIAKQSTPKWGSVLFLLSTGEDKDLEVVKKWMSNEELIVKSVGKYPWGKGYVGPSLCEYYLRTGDKKVLPLIQQMTEELRVLEYNGGWSGRGGASFGYMQGGQMHAAGVHCLTFLLMARYCGVEVDEGMMQRSLNAFYRFAGHGNVAYGNQPPEGGLRDNGKTGGLAVAMEAAALLTPEGENSVYAKARDNSAMKGFYATNWFHAAHTGGGIGEIWHHSAMNTVRETRPRQYRSYFDTRRWVMELSRRWDGGIGIAGMTDRYDVSTSEHNLAWGTYFALTYTLPRKQLQLFGAPKSKWAKNYALPTRPWGNAADDAFQLNTPIKAKGGITMDELLSETVPRDSSLPLMKRVGAKPSEGGDLILLKYLAHPEFAVRSGTMRFVVEQGRTDIVVDLLQSKDPRSRHAAILGIKGMFKGRPLPKDKLTPEMFELVGKIIENRDESWWVLQDAIHALRRADTATIAKHRNRLIEVLDYDCWWMQVAALQTLIQIAFTEEHYKSVLPPLIDTYTSFKDFRAQGDPIAEMVKKLQTAEAPIQKLAYSCFKKAYNNIPGEITMPGGYVLPHGSRIHKSRYTQLLGALPGGDLFVMTQPKNTLEYLLSSKEEDKYTYSGKFTPNEKLVGVWKWALWPQPKTPQEVVPFIKRWIKGRKQKAKDTIHILEGGKTKKSGYYKGYFWSGDMLINKYGDDARKIELHTVEGRDFIAIPKGSFDKKADSPDWHPGYHVYVRQK
ncbi:MAG: PDZ domain-containing protein [Verrucomicrobiae bacterium]|nr:PDZ domain-containing protein [Verrucomicrobiae bacterium]NNJ42976.1 PDZ domain-containing protein [Akkermansiaceae bacterium]